MLSIESLELGDGFLVTGYADGTDWMVYVGGGLLREGPYGIMADRYVYLLARRNPTDGRQRLRIWDCIARCQIHAIDLDCERAPLTRSRDGRHAYIFARTNFLIVDIPAGRIVRQHAPVPVCFEKAIERDDGKLIYQVTEYQSPMAGLVLLDPVTGTFESDMHDTGLRTKYTSPGWKCPSPDGRYWLRHDVNVLPVHFISGPDQKQERVYGITLQLWEAYPLKFVRRLVFEWVRDPRPGNISRMPALFHIIAEAAAKADVGPFGNIPRSAYPATIANDDAAWEKIEDYRIELDKRSSNIAWQPDSQAFWVKCYGVIPNPWDAVCVGIDGTISPTLRVQRSRGIIDQRFIDDVIALPNRRASLKYRLYESQAVNGLVAGTLELDGAASTNPFSTVDIPPQADHWVKDERNLSARLAKIKVKTRTIVVPLAQMSEAGCIAAVDALTARVTDDFHLRAVDNEICAVFKSKLKAYSEPNFFAEVSANYPGVAPSIRKLIDTFAANPNNAGIWWNGDKGIAAFSHAVLALGVMDATALPTIRRYGELLDGEHEIFFIDKTVPALLKTHGWTEESIDFGIWLMVYNETATFQDYDTIWKRWGMGKAVMAERTPQAFAARFVAELPSDADVRDRHLRGLRGKFPNADAPWLVEFFKQMKILVPSLQD